MTRLGPSTITEVAARAGVSIRTVSRVLNGALRVDARTRSRVEATIAELNYAPNPRARAMALSRSFLVGLVHDDPDGGRFDRTARSAAEVCAVHGSELVLFACQSHWPDLQSRIERFVRRSRVDGVLVGPVLADAPNLHGDLTGLGAPSVLMSAGDDFDQPPSTSAGDAGLCMAAHFLREGHKHVGLICGPSADLTDAVIAGFEYGILSAGLAAPPIVYGEHGFAGGVTAAERLLELARRPTAVFVLDVTMGAGLLDLVQRRGIGVPQDLSVAAFEGDALAPALTPPLTTVRRSDGAAARAAAERLFASIDAGAKATQRLKVDQFGHEVVVRGSTAPAGPGPLGKDA